MQALHPPCPAVPQSAGGVFPRGSAGVFRLVSQPSGRALRIPQRTRISNVRPRGRDAGLHAGVAATPVGLVSPARADRLAQGSAAAPGRAAHGRVGAGICPRHLQAVASRAQHKDRISDPGHWHVCRENIGRPVSAAALVDVQKRAAKRHIRQYAAADRLCADRGHAGQRASPAVPPGV